VSAYAIIDALVLDDTHYEEYRRIAQETIRQYGGRYLARGVPELLEGAWPSSQRAVLLEFPSVERIKEWYSSTEYEVAKKIREGAMDVRLIVIEADPA